MSERRRILKFVLKPIVTQFLTADEPRCLAVGAQGDDVVLWVEATVGDGPWVTSIVAVMTGQTPPPDGSYIGTTQVGAIVVHAYRVPA
jgi:hypothetical protein